LSITTLCGSVKTDKKMMVKKKGEILNSKYENANKRIITPTILMIEKGSNSFIK
jgi:hypothetical protein